MLPQKRGSDAVRSSPFEDCRSKNEIAVLHVFFGAGSRIIVGVTDYAVNRRPCSATDRRVVAICHRRDNGLYLGKKALRSPRFQRRQRSLGIVINTKAITMIVRCGFSAEREMSGWLTNAVAAVDNPTCRRPRRVSKLCIAVSLPRTYRRLCLV